MYNEFLQRILSTAFTTAENHPEKTYSIKISWEEDIIVILDVSAAAASHYAAYIFFSYHNVAMSSIKALNAQLPSMNNESLSERLRKLIND